MQSDIRMTEQGGEISTIPWIVGDTHTAGAVVLLLIQIPRILEYIDDTLCDSFWSHRMLSGNQDSKLVTSQSVYICFQTSCTNQSQSA